MLKDQIFDLKSWLAEAMTEPINQYVRNCTACLTVQKTGKI